MNDSRVVVVLVETMRPNLNQLSSFNVSLSCYSSQFCSGFNHLTKMATPKCNFYVCTQTEEARIDEKLVSVQKG